MCFSVPVLLKTVYNPKRHHGSNNGLSPLQYEKRYFKKQETVYQAKSCLTLHIKKEPSRSTLEDNND